VKDLIYIAGPCAVESLDQIMSIGRAVKDVGATHLRFMLYKPRTNPGSFQGVGDEGLGWTGEVRENVGLPLVTEVLDTRDVRKLADYFDILQIGSRNSQNFALIKEVGNVARELGVGVILKRGASNTVDEWWGAYNYLEMDPVNPGEVYMCERGVRSATNPGPKGNILDLSAVPLLNTVCHNVIVDPSHGTGKSSLVERMSLAAVAAGADGLEIEVHTNPLKSKSDPYQAITPDEFGEVVRKCNIFRRAFEEAYRE
jgi:3-deoxy-7-phosphoheptulonate synthase